MNEDHEFRIGEKVEFHPSEAFFSANCDVYISKYYPKVGTVGTVIGRSVKTFILYSSNGPKVRQCSTVVGL